MDSPRTSMLRTDADVTTAGPRPLPFAEPFERSHDVEFPVVIAGGGQVGSEHRALGFDVPSTPASIDFEVEVESVAIAKESHIEVALASEGVRVAALVVAVPSGERKPARLHGFLSAGRNIEVQVTAKTGGASVRGRLQLQSVGGR